MKTKPDFFQRFCLDLDVPIFNSKDVMQEWEISFGPIFKNPAKKPDVNDS